MKRIIKRAQSGIIVTPLFMLFSCIYAEPTVVVDHVDKSFNKITSIEVEGSFCSVTVTPQEGNNVSLTGEIKAGSQRDDVKIKYSESNNVLKVWIEHPRLMSGNLNGKLEFRVPANTNVNVDNSSGSINVSNIGKGIVTLKASSGSITATKINSNLSCQTSSGSQSISEISGNLKTSSSSGSQHLKDIGGTLETSASSGSIKIEGVSKNLTAETSSGGLSVANSKGNVKVKATSGSIHISGVTGNVSVQTSSGSINLNQVVGSLNTQSSSGSQSGNGIKLTGNSSFSSSSGSIDMGLNNDASELSFDLNASSGGLYAKGIKGSKNLVISKGALKITGQSSSGSQSYK